MAEDSEQERSLPATPRRLEQAREEGQVPRSRELAAFATVGAGAAVAWWGGPVWSAACGRLLERGLTLRGPEALSDQALVERFTAFVLDGLLVAAPVLALAAALATGGALAVGGWLFAPKAFSPDLARLSPARGLGQIFSRHGLIELAKAVAKALVVGAAGALFIWSHQSDLAALGSMGARDGVAAAGTLAAGALVWLAGALLAIAALDVPAVLWRHRVQLRMSREEVRRELRESEGDPHLKARVRSQQREMARRRMMAAVPTADVVVTNPTHYAVAIAYRAGEMRAPTVVAKGQGEVAARIRSLAEAHGVPRLEAPALARALFRATEIGDEIPAALYGAVAQVLAWVYKLRSARPGDEPPAPAAIDVPPELDWEAR